MKFLKYFAVFVVAAFLSLNIFSQPDPGHNGDGSGSNGGPIGGGAPIGGGLLILISLGAGYGLTKFYNAKKRRLDE